MASFIIRQMDKNGENVSYSCYTSGSCVGEISDWQYKEYVDGVEISPTGPQAWYNVTYTLATQTLDVSCGAVSSVSSHTLDCIPIIDGEVCNGKIITFIQEGKDNPCTCIKNIHITSNIPQEGIDNLTGVEVGDIELKSGCYASDISFTNLKGNGTLTIKQSGSSYKLYANVFSMNRNAENRIYNFLVTMINEDGEEMECDTLSIEQDGLNESCGCYAILNYQIKPVKLLFDCDDLENEQLFVSGTVRNDCGILLPTQPTYYDVIMTTSTTVADSTDYMFYLKKKSGFSCDLFYGVTIKIRETSGELKDCAYPMHFIGSSLGCDEITCPSSDITIGKVVGDLVYPITTPFTIPWRSCSSSQYKDIANVGFINPYTTWPCDANYDTMVTSNGVMPYGLTLEKLTPYGLEAIALFGAKVDSSGYVWYRLMVNSEPDEWNFSSTPRSTTYALQFGINMQAVDIRNSYGTIMGYFGRLGKLCQSTNFEIIQEAFPQPCECGDWKLIGKNDNYEISTAITLSNAWCGGLIDTDYIEFRCLCYPYYEDINTAIPKHHSLARFSVDTTNTANWLIVGEVTDACDVDFYGSIALKPLENDTETSRFTTFDITYLAADNSICRKTIQVNQRPCSESPDPGPDSCKCDKLGVIGGTSITLESDGTGLAGDYIEFNVLGTEGGEACSASSDSYSLDLTYASGMPSGWVKASRDNTDPPFIQGNRIHYYVGKNGKDTPRIAYITIMWHSTKLGTDCQVVVSITQKGVQKSITSCTEFNSIASTSTLMVYVQRSGTFNEGADLVTVNDDYKMSGTTGYNRWQLSWIINNVNPEVWEIANGATETIARTVSVSNIIQHGHAVDAYIYLKYTLTDEQGTVIEECIYPTNTEDAHFGGETA